MDKKISNIKDRVLYISELQEVNKEKFFEELGVSYANFKGIQKKSALNSDTIAKILTKYPEIDPEWLILGTGSHWRSSYVSIDDVLPNKSKVKKEVFDNSLERENVFQKKLIELQESSLIDKDKIISNLEKQLSELKFTKSEPFLYSNVAERTPELIKKKK
jgi:hypothetical protein